MSILNIFSNGNILRQPDAVRATKPRISGVPVVDETANRLFDAEVRLINAIITAGSEGSTTLLNEMTIGRTTLRTLNSVSRHLEAETLRAVQYLPGAEVGVRLERRIDSLTAESSTGKARQLELQRAGSRLLRWLFVNQSQIQKLFDAGREEDVDQKFLVISQTKHPLTGNRTIKVSKVETNEGEYNSSALTSLIRNIQSDVLNTRSGTRNRSFGLLTSLDFELSVEIKKGGSLAQQITEGHTKVVCAQRNVEHDNDPNVEVDVNLLKDFSIGGPVTSEAVVKLLLSAEELILASNEVAEVLEQSLNVEGNQLIVEEGADSETDPENGSSADTTGEEEATTDMSEQTDEPNDD
jgi:hypothetical protein